MPAKTSFLLLVEAISSSAPEGSIGDNRVQLHQYASVQILNKTRHGRYLATAGFCYPFNSCILPWFCNPFHQGWKHRVPSRQPRPGQAGTDPSCRSWRLSAMRCSRLVWRTVNQQCLKHNWGVIKEATVPLLPLGKVRSLILSRFKG